MFPQVHGLHCGKGRSKERHAHPGGHQGDEEEMEGRGNSVEILLGQNRSTNKRGRVAAENIEGKKMSPK